jgi:hypothetical protein
MFQRERARGFVDLQRQFFVGRHLVEGDRGVEVGIGKVAAFLFEVVEDDLALGAGGPGQVDLPVDRAAEDGRAAHADADVDVRRGLLHPRGVGGGVHDAGEVRAVEEAGNELERIRRAGGIELDLYLVRSARLDVGMKRICSLTGAMPPAALGPAAPVVLYPMNRFGLLPPGALRC